MGNLPELKVENVSELDWLKEFPGGFPQTRARRDGSWVWSKAVIEQDSTLSHQGRQLLNFYIKSIPDLQEEAYKPGRAGFSEQRYAEIKEGLHFLPGMPNIAVRLNQQLNPRLILPEARQKMAESKLAITASFDAAKKMLDEALKHVGATTYSGPYHFRRRNLTNFEAFFGARDSRNASAFEHRKSLVRENLLAIQAAIEHCVIYIDATPTDRSAYFNKGEDGVRKLTIGKLIYDGDTPYFTAGVLIHEVGHVIGLEDMCGQCHTAMLKDKTASKPPAGCMANNLHGKTPAASDPNNDFTGHFIGLAGTRLMAQAYAEATPWNADSYRWFCGYAMYDQFSADYTARPEAKNRKLPQTYKA